MFAGTLDLLRIQRDAAPLFLIKAFGRKLRPLDAHVPSPIEERIRELCRLIKAAKDDAAITRLLSELKAANAEYIHNIRTMAVKLIPRMFGTDNDKNAA